MCLHFLMILGKRERKKHNSFGHPIIIFKKFLIFFQKSPRYVYLDNGRNNIFFLL